MATRGNGKPLALVALLVLVSGIPQPSNGADNNWWQHAIIYQVYPRSFKDSNADGVGDLNGITSKLEHIKELGATGLWLSPIYASPQVDFGYDVSNFTDIDPIYGDFADFDRLVDKAHRLGLKLLLDLVPNHSSDRHEWFQKSVNRIKPYDEYYVWRDGRIGPKGERLPPSNWLSVFGGPAWTWSDSRKQYYYHQFVPAQPDLNYRSPLLRREMERVMEFWLGRGVDGFRIDAIIHLFEDERLRDEPRSFRPGVLADEYEYLEHPYTKDQNETYGVVADWRALMDRHGPGKYAIVEGSSMRYYDVGVDPFNFMFTTKLNNDSRPADYVSEIRGWLDNMPRGRTANWVTGNHDTSRAGSRLGYNSNRSDQLSMLVAVLPGLMVIYNGDEIGMLDRAMSYKETVDPAGCRAGPQRYHIKSRDPARTPYQWDATTNAGFSTSSKTWLPVHENYKTLNLAAQRSPSSPATTHYKLFRRLSMLRKISPQLSSGQVEVSASLDGRALGVVRRLAHRRPIALIVNFAGVDLHLDLRTWMHLPDTMSLYAVSVKSGLKLGAMVDLKRNFTLPAAATVIFI
ncbi:maltase 1-like [Copidosoma floridanum]|uniref:maltase 1-like n=1 Tax=Copidosoma floridanum TaxID=29053 RepID=UPI0006C9AF9C|nr:maltase 1-like [Copidosoma floridanum]